MPQLDFTTYFSQLFWLFFSFSGLYIFASCLFLPRLNSVLEQRKNLINQAQYDTEHMNREIEHKIKKVNMAVEDANLAADHITAEARKIAQQLKGDALLQFTKEEGLIRLQNIDLRNKAKKEKKQELKRAAFDATLKYYDVVLSRHLDEEVVDFASIKDLAYKNIESLLKKEA